MSVTSTDEKVAEPNTDKKSLVGAMYDAARIRFDAGILPRGV